MNIFIQIAAYHPLVCITLFFSLGIATGYHLPLPTSLQTSLLLFLCLLLIVFFTVCYKKTPPARIRLALIIPFAFLLGILHISFAIQIPDEENALYSLFTQKKEAVIVGMLQQMPQNSGIITSAVIASKWLRLKEDKGFRAVKGKVLLRLKGTWPPDMLPGDTIIVRADIKHPKSYHTSGTFNYPRYLAEKGIFLNGFIRSPLFLHKIISKNQGSIRVKMERYRTIIGNAINRQLPPQQAGLYRAILLGDRSAISPSILENFKACGVLHLLAISGIHITVIWSIFYFLCYQILSQSKFLLLHYPVHTIAALFTLPFITAYALLSGLQTPVLRATIMSATLVIALIRRQQTTAAPLLATAALLILLLHPMQLFSASFQLSFIAVATIFFLLPLLKKIISPQQEKEEKRSPPSKKIWRWIAASTLLSTGISILTAPVTAFHFNRISVVAPLANLLIEPLLCLWALPCGLLATPFLLAQDSATLAQLPLQLGAAGISLASSILDQIARLPFNFSWVRTTEPFFLWGNILFYSGLFLLTIGREKIAAITEKKRGYFRKKMRLTGCAIIFSSLSLFFCTPPQKNRITFLDVGQGSATLVEFANGSTILIDGGGASSSTSSVGERVIAPYLLKKGKKGIDAVVLTHPDADHSNGLPHILVNFSPKKLWVRAADEKNTLHQQLLTTASQANCQVNVAQKGERLSYKKGNFLSCIYNFGKPAKSSAYEKNRGLVLLAELDGWKFLFPGDIDKEAEKMLLTEIKTECNVFLASHHGSKTSNSKKFIDTLNPLIVIASAGQKEGIFPSSQLIDSLQERGIPLLTTARDGTIEMEIHKKEVLIKSYGKEQDNPFLPCRYKKRGRLRQVSLPR